MSHFLDELTRRILEAPCEKYEKLVWFARSLPAEDPDWEGTPEEIKTKALNEQARIEEHYLAEVEALYGEGGDWQHGFHSGMLAALRLVLTSIDQGIDQAVEEFPMLDT